MHSILPIVYNYQEIHVYLTFRVLLVFATVMIHSFHTKSKKRFHQKTNIIELRGLLREVYCK